MAECSWLEGNKFEISRQIQPSRSLLLLIVLLFIGVEVTSVKTQANRRQKTFGRQKIKSCNNWNSN
jgi:hypothetical protein